MTNKKLQHNAMAISEVVAKSGVSSEEFKKADSEISKALQVVITSEVDWIDKEDV